MDREARTQIIAITVVGTVVIMLAAFLWPGSGGVAVPSSPTMLYDEALVEEIYHRVSPAVVEIYADSQSGDSFNQTSAGSGFLIDSEGFIATNYHVIERADRVRVSFVNGPEVEAKILGRNPANARGHALFMSWSQPSTHGCASSTSVLTLSSSPIEPAAGMLNRWAPSTIARRTSLESSTMR